MTLAYTLPDRDTIVDDYRKCIMADLTTLQLPSPLTAEQATAILTGACPPTEGQHALLLACLHTATQILLRTKTCAGTEG